MQMRSAVKERHQYAVDLRAQQAECDANYVRLLKLLPKLSEQNCWEYTVDGNTNALSERVRLSVIEHAPYTSTVEIEQLSCALNWSEQPDRRVLRVRMYHDAQMAEVVAWNTYWNTRARYSYPNQHMHQIDEKAQLNRFLGEWLSHCLSCGRVVTTIAE